MASQFGHENIVRVLLQSGSKDIPNKVIMQSFIKQVYMQTVNLLC